MSRRIRCSVLLVLLVLPAAVPAQVENATAAALAERDPFSVDAISFAALNSADSRLDIFVQVPYENLSFVQEEGQYAASYELTITILDSGGALAVERTWNEQVRTASFEESVSAQSSSLIQRSFPLRPGQYSLAVQVRDDETRRPVKVERRITVQNYARAAFALSDVMLIRRLVLAGDRKSILPNVGPELATVGDVLWLFLEAYNDVREDSVRFVATVFDGRKELKLTADSLQFVQRGRNQVFLRVDVSTLPLGEYSLYVQAVPVYPWDEVSARSYLNTTNRTFRVRWSGLPRSVADLDLAVEQLRYIARDAELDSIREAPTAEEKQRLFMEFWKARDPNPNTPRNEKMEQHYARVEYANKNFKHYIEGWRTDMGMVYILFGPPSNVDRHPFDIDAKPYEVWAYYELNYSFVFVDQSGFGDYRLITPIWDVWQRAKQ